MNPITIAPGIGATFYGSLPRDLDAHRDVIEASDLVCLHTSADASDVASAARVRALGCSRVWLGIPANYLVSVGARRGLAGAVAESERIARVALDMGCEVLEFNGEGSSDGKKPGDWIPADPTEAVKLAQVAAAVPVAVQVLDKLFDGLAILVVGALAWHRIIDGTLGAGLVVFIATGNTGIRALSARAGGPAVGVVGLALIAGLSVAGYTPAVVAAPVAVAVLQRASGGHARASVLAFVALCISGAGVAAIFGYAVHTILAGWVS